MPGAGVDTRHDTKSGTGGGGAEETSDCTEKGVSEFKRRKMQKTERDGKGISRNKEPGFRDQRERTGIVIGRGSEGRLSWRQGKFTQVEVEEMGVEAKHQQI